MQMYSYPLISRIIQILAILSLATTLPPKGSTTQPKAASSETPSGRPSTVVIVSASACVTGWGYWIDRDTPHSDDKEVEGWNSTEKAAFCIGGKITSIECETFFGIPHYSSGEVKVFFQLATVGRKTLRN